MLSGGNGNDTLEGDWNNDTMDGGPGIDTLFLPGGAPTPVTVNLATGIMTGGDTAGTAQAVISNIESVDAGGLGVSVTMTGSSGNDLLRGGMQADLINGGAGDDTIYGSAFSQNANGDQLYGGDGNDQLSAFGGNTLLDGGTGTDLLSGGPGADSFVFDVTPGAANEDSVFNFQSGTDKIHLDARVMSALGTTGNLSAGDPRFYAAPNANAGHDADDRVVYDTTSGFLFYDPDGSGPQQAQVIATFSATNQSSITSPASLSATDIVVDNGTTGGTPPPPGSIVGTDGNDTITGTTGNDTIFGLGGNDVVFGDAGADSIVGGTGNDSLNGNAGADWLEGGAGNDALSGGGDQDSFVFREFGAANADTVSDFASNWDMLRFDASAFTALGGAGHFAAGDARFYAAAGATGGHDADDRLIYNTSTGQLYYDADGSGAGAAQLVATLQGAPGVAASDVWVI
jgi:Ca2+-binding RTX toxin-like protein